MTLLLAAGIMGTLIGGRIQEYVPHHVGIASGVTLGLAVTVGGIVAPVLGHVADLYGIHTALMVLRCLGGIGLL